MTWEQRYHPLRREWVIVAAHRQNRPWQGETVARQFAALPSYAPDCYLCPGNLRVSGQRNPDYKDVFVFENDHPCVGTKAPSSPVAPSGYVVRPATGSARVLCYSPLHNLTLAELRVDEIVLLLRAWQQQYVELGKLPEVAHVLIFENKGEAVGVSNPHPHCQIYATNFVFKTIEEELVAEREHYAQTRRILFQDIIVAEKQDGRRILSENNSAIGFLPYFARYSYETLVAPKQAHSSIASLSESELLDLAAVMKNVLVRFDNLWQTPFPYVLVLHQAPTDGGDHSPHHFYLQFLPPLRGPTLRKFLAGPELGGGCFVSDTAPETSAAELLAVSDTHYKDSP